MCTISLSEFQENSDQSLLSLIENISATSENVIEINILVDSDYDIDYGYVFRICNLFLQNQLP